MTIRQTLVLTGAGIVLATPALAHGTLPGGGGFYSGLLHPVYAVEHLVALFALGLLTGRSGQRAALLALAAGVTVGLTLLQQPPLPPMAPLMLATVLAGIALAVPVAPHPALTAALAAGLGTVVGADSDAPTQAGMAGLATGIALVVLNAMALAGPFARPAREIVLRVAGSWLVAVAVLLLTLSAVRNGGGG